MLTSRQSNMKTTRLPSLFPNLGDISQRQQLQVKSSHRPSSTQSSQSIDNAYSLEHLYTALSRRIHRIIQHYNAASFHYALKICARTFQSYASYNLNTIEGFIRHLNKNARDNKKVLILIEQFQHELAELRHCHSTFEAELLVTTLVIDFHENDLDQQTNLSLSNGKFSPRSRLSKFRYKHIRQAIELKSQLRQTNEDLQILLFDEFNANLSNLWEESEKYILTSIPFHDHHMTYILRLIPDIVFKFEYALQLCTKLFELETTIVENYSQTDRNHKRVTITTPNTMITLTPRSDSNQQQLLLSSENYQRIKPNIETQKTSVFIPSDDIHTSSITKLPDRIDSPISLLDHVEPVDMTDATTLLLSSEKINDQMKLRLLIEQFDKRLNDEKSSYQCLLNCIQQTAKKFDQLNGFPKTKMLSLVMSDDPAVVEYQTKLYLSDYQIYKSVEDELNIALRETQYRIEWIEMARTRAYQCLDR